MRYETRALKICLLTVLISSIGYLHASAQTITLYSFPPPHPYQWQSPSRLMISTIKNHYFNTKGRHYRKLGHMVVELKKDSTVLLAAMAADDKMELKQSISKGKLGLGILFKIFDGHIEDTHVLQEELELKVKKNNVAFISFRISDSAYAYLISYIDSFKMKGYDKLYNGLNSPRAGKGCGCTAFGISFLNLIGAFDPEFEKEWAVHVNVPEKLIGDKSRGKKVSVWRILFSFKWASKNQAHQKLVLYEPYLIYQWINRKWDEESNKANSPYKLRKLGQAKGLEVICRTCVPRKPMFQ